mgnify:CR=1 FL=1
MEEEANLFNKAYLLKLPWLPSCITLNPIAAIKQPKKTHNKSTAFGKIYDTNEIIVAIEQFQQNNKTVQFNFEFYDDYINKTAAYLADGKVIGWFQDGAEFGPRALGGRSIIADPRNEKAKELFLV